jgi:betaine lipid synthase
MIHRAQPEYGLRVCRQLSFEDTWAMFGEGRHPRIEQLFEAKLAPFLSEASLKFWQSRLWYFKKGLYYQGGMVRRPSHT